MAGECAVNDVLLPETFLTDLRLGLSASGSADLPRLGLRENHLRSVLGEIARVVLVGGGKLAYGGHLDPTGYTAFLASELQRYGRRDQPLLVCLAWNEHRRLSLAELDSRTDLGMFGKVICLDVDGSPIDPARGRGEDPVPEQDPETLERALTSMRRYMGTQINGRVLIGGKRRDFSGAIPGLMEEALIALEAGQPLYLAAGCGGATVDIARALGVDDCAWLPSPPDAAAEDPRLVDGYARLAAFADSADWDGLRNGLTPEENARLARTSRASDIAAYVSLGLGRIAQDGVPAS